MCTDACQCRHSTLTYPVFVGDQADKFILVVFGNPGIAGGWYFGGSDYGVATFECATCACIAALPIGFLHAFDANMRASLRRMQHFAITNIDADVVDNTSFTEENEVTRLGLFNSG